MKTPKVFGWIFLAVAMLIGIALYFGLSFPINFEDYFKADFYKQFGPLAIAVELFVAGLYLLRRHKKTNFALALFGFTALLDPILSFFGLFESQVPLFAAIVFAICALVALWMVFSDPFKQGRLSFFTALVSFALGTAIELFFNLP